MLKYGDISARNIKNEHTVGARLYNEVCRTYVSVCLYLALQSWPAIVGWF